MAREFLMTSSVLAAFCAAMLAGGTAFAAGDVPPDHRIGYALYGYEWALYQTPDGKAECPKGLNDGPREQFDTLFPNAAAGRTLAETRLKREAETWWPTLTPESYEFKQAQGKIAPGLNLDGRIGANDFTNPEGERGIDNNMYRVLGCIESYRGPTGSHFYSTTRDVQVNLYSRVMIELTDVDSLDNDDDVTVTTYRGRDGLLSDGSGNIVPGGTQRIDTRWGKEFIYKIKGRIKGGVLTTQPIDYTFPADGSTIHEIKGMRLQLKLTPDQAEGLMAGYTDVETFYRQLNHRDSPHLSYGHVSAQSLYRALHHLADGYPDQKTGQNTAISSALKVRYAQVFVQHPDNSNDVALAPPPIPSAAVRGQR